MKPNVIITSILVILLLSVGCKPKSNCVSAGGGKGGSAIITITPKHIGLNVDSCTIYVKYGTLDAPTSGVYDDSQKVILVDTTPVAIFTHLKAGLYYFYGKGYHVPYSAYVKGGANYTMCSEHAETVYLPTYAYIP